MIDASRRILPDLTKADVVVPFPGKTLRRVDPARVAELFQMGKSDFEMAAALGCSRGAVIFHRKRLNLFRPRGPRAGNVPSAAKPLSRHEPKTLLGKSATMPPVDHPALTEARTIYPSTVVSPRGLLNVLVSGENSHKIGSTITKGKWKGFPVFTLTLEERATCPTSCAMWRSCYGNQMNWAKRIQVGDEFEARLASEICVLSYRYPKGFAVRLHVLGDFYSVAYVELWRAMIERFPNLHAFGFSARRSLKDPIASALIALVDEQWDRFAIRFSNAPSESYSTVTIEHPLQKPADAVLCPAQTGKTKCSSTCAFCWQSTRRVAFLRH